MYTAELARATRDPAGSAVYSVFPRTRFMLGKDSVDDVRPQPTDDTDVDLMLRVREGDADAFEALLEAFWDGAFAYARGLVGEPDDARDIAQEVFLRLWKSRRDWEAHGSVRAWIFRTARNLCISQHRRSAVRRRFAVTQRAVPRPRPRSALRQTEDGEFMEAVREAVERLSPRRREAFTLFYLQDLSYREASEVMGVREQTVANYLQAALAELRIFLERFSPADPDRGAAGGDTG